MTRTRAIAAALAVLAGCGSTVEVDEEALEAEARRTYARFCRASCKCKNRPPDHGEEDCFSLCYEWSLFDRDIYVQVGCVRELDAYAACRAEHAPCPASEDELLGACGTEVEAFSACRRSDTAP